MSAVVKNDQETIEEKRVRWPDFSAIDPELKLQATTLPSGRRCLVFVNGDNHAAELKSLGFVYGDKSRLWIRNGSAIESGEIAAWNKAFPGLVYRPTPASAIIRRFGANTANASANNAEVMIAQAIRLGNNHLGQAVYDSVDGRFAVAYDTEKNADGEAIFKPKIIREDQLPPERGSAFLRAFDALSLGQCCAGLIASVIDGHVVTEDVFARFFTSVTQPAKGAPPSTFLVNDVRTAMLSAIDKRIANNAAASTYDTYELARKLQTGFQALALIATPLPISIIAKRLVASRDELTNSVVGLRNDASNINPHLPAGVTIDEIDDAIQSAQNFQITSESSFDSDAFIAMAPLDLDLRTAEGRSVYFVAGDLTDDFKDSLSAIGVNYDISGLIRVGSPLTTGTIGDAASTLIVIGQKRVMPVTDFSIETELSRHQTAMDFDSLWQWSSALVAARAENRKLAEKKKRSEKTLETEVVDQEGEARQVVNDFQTPYISASSPNGASEVMVPRYLEGASREALDGLVRRHGDITAFVAGQLMMNTDYLQSIAGPEQIDAVAQEIDTRLRGKSVVIADENGVGKGRQLSLMIVWSALRNEPTLFMTKNEKLFSDIFRDLRAISREHLINPIILNDSGSVYDHLTGEAIFSSPHREITAGIIESGVIPEEINLIMASYTQINKKPEQSAKTRWLIDNSSSCRLIADEAHEAAGESSQVGKNFTAIMNRARHVTYSSATWATRISNLPIYKRALPMKLNVDALQKLVSSNGLVAQEALSATMVREGTLIRRERDNSQAEYIIYRAEDDAYRRNYDYSAALAPILSAISYLSSDVKQHIHVANQARADLDNARNERNANSTQIYSSGFGSAHYLISKMSTIAMNTDGVIAYALSELEQNRKPIIVVEHTAENYLRAILDEDAKAQETAPTPIAESDIFDDIDAAPATVESVTVIEPRVFNRIPDFKDLLKSVVDRVTQIRQTHRNTNQNLELSPSMVAAKAQIIEMIDQLPPLPLIPIDAVKMALQARGYSVGEITGRKLEYRNGRIQTRAKTNIHSETIKFQNGEYHAVILGKSGFAGISLHADVAALDQNQRSLIMFETPSNVVDLTQVLGRANRRGQVIWPRVAWVSSRMPVEQRLSMIMEHHLHKLAANCTSNRASPISRDDIPDIFNSIGHDVAHSFIELNPDLARLMNLDVEDIEGEEDDDTSEKLDVMWANKVMAYINLLHPEQQERVINDLFTEYKARVEELDTTNTNPLKAKELPGTWEVTNESDVLEHNENQSVIIATVKGTRQIKPARSNDLLQMVENNDQRILQAIMNTQIKRGYNDIMSSWSDRSVYRDSQEVRAALVRMKPERLELLIRSERQNFASVEQALAADGNNIVKEVAARFDRLIELLDRGLRPGSAVNFRNLDTYDPAPGVIVDVMMPARGYEDKAWLYRVTMLMPGMEKSHAFTLSLSSLVADPVFDIPQQTRDYVDQVFNAFDTAPEGKVSQERKMLLSSNLLRVMEISDSRRPKWGYISAFTDKAGVVHRGLVISKKHISELRETILPRLANEEIAWMFLSASPCNDLAARATKANAKTATVNQRSVAAFTYPTKMKKDKDKDTLSTASSCLSIRYRKKAGKPPEIVLVLGSAQLLRAECENNMAFNQVMTSIGVNLDSGQFDERIADQLELEVAEAGLLDGNQAPNAEAEPDVEDAKLTAKRERREQLQQRDALRKERMAHFALWGEHIYDSDKPKSIPIEPHEAADIIHQLYNAGISLYVHNTHRTWVNNVMGQMGLDLVEEAEEAEEENEQSDERIIELTVTSAKTDEIAAVNDDEIALTVQQLTRFF